MRFIDVTCTLSADVGVYCLKPWDRTALPDFTLSWEQRDLRQYRKQSTCLILALLCIDSQVCLLLPCGLRWGSPPPSPAGSSNRWPHGGHSATEESHISCFQNNITFNTQITFYSVVSWRLTCSFLSVFMLQCSMLQLILTFILYVCGNIYSTIT